MLHVICTEVDTVKICGVCAKEMTREWRKFWHKELCNLCLRNAKFLKMNEWINISIRRVIISGVPRGLVWGVQTPPPRNSEDIGEVLDRMSKKNRRLDFLL